MKKVLGFVLAILLAVSVYAALPTDRYTTVIDAKIDLATVGLVPDRAARVPYPETMVLYVLFSAGATGGSVTIETALSDDYSGTWGSLAVVNAAAATQYVVAIKQPLSAVRTRISSAITGGGTVTVYYLK